MIVRTAQLRLLEWDAAQASATESLRYEKVSNLAEGTRRNYGPRALLLSGYEGMKAGEKSILPNRPNRFTEALERVVELRTAMEKPDAAAEWTIQLQERQARDSGEHLHSSSASKE